MVAASRVVVHRIAGMVMMPVIAVIMAVMMRGRLTARIALMFLEFVIGTIVTSTTSAAGLTCGCC
jgi:hypothetical protein